MIQRGGTVIPLKTSVGKSTEWMADVSYELRAALDDKVMHFIYFYIFLPIIQILYKRYLL